MHQQPTSALLSAADIQEFRALLRTETGRELSADDTRRIVERMLHFYHLCETVGKEPRQDITGRQREPGQPFTARELETEATLALRALQEHLAHVDQRPSTWRWAIVALHSALKYSLQARLAGEEPPKEPPEDALTLFRRVSELMPELPQVEETIGQLDTLRWKYLAKQLSLWPVGRGALSTITNDIVRMIRRLRREDALLMAISDQVDRIASRVAA